MITPHVPFLGLLVIVFVLMFRWVKQDITIRELKERLKEESK